jgi:hypothetical protein
MPHHQNVITCTSIYLYMHIYIHYHTTTVFILIQQNAIPFQRPYFSAKGVDSILEPGGVLLHEIST